MKYLIFLFILSISTVNATEYMHRPNKMYATVQVICEGGYKFVLATIGTYRGQGIDVTQVFTKDLEELYPPQPVKCKE